MIKSYSRAEALIKYLQIITTLPMYSMHYFEVKDKKDVLQWLGVGPDGITVSSSSSRNEPQDENTLRFQWLQLQNIFYRDRKFSMEVYQNSKANKKGSFGPVSVHAWYGSNPKVVMAIWKMSRDQHMFYRSKRASRSPHVHMNGTEIQRQLNKLHASNISPSSSQSSLSVESARSNQMQASAEAVAAAKAAQNEMYQALLSRRQQLMTDLETRAAQYKDLLLKEMQITGIPPDGLTSEEIERMRKKFGVSFNFKFSKFVLDDSTAGSSEVEELEKQLEIQSSIIEASKALLSQANTRRLKKDRKKEIREALDRYQSLEDKIFEMKRSQRGLGMGPASSTRFHVDTPNEVRISSSSGVTSSGGGGGGGGGGSMVLGGSRTIPSGSSVDDTVINSLIWESPSHNSISSPSSNTGGGGGGLQKSPLHKSTSALNDLQDGSVSTATSVPATSRVNYQGHPHLTPHNNMRERESQNKSHRPPVPEEVMFSPPPLPPVSAGLPTPRNKLPDFDLSTEIFQHFSGRSRKDVTPPTHDFVSPRQTTSGTELRSHFPLPPRSTSSPRKQTSSPEISVYHHGDQREGSSSPVFLPTPEHHRHHRPPQPSPSSSSSSPYPNSSYHHTTPNRAPAPPTTHSNIPHPPPSRSPSSSSNTKTSYHHHRGGGGGGGVTSPPWYDGQTQQKPQVSETTNRTPHREEGGAYRQGQQTQKQTKPSKIPLPRRRNEESVGIQEFLSDLAESKTNPFEGGTLV